MNDLQKFHAYRALLGSPADIRVHWWYVGTMLAHCPGLPPLPVIQATTLMVYRMETLNPTSFAIHWDEVGYFTDYVTGEPVTDWTNPLTGRTEQSPKNFKEGPACYIVTLNDAGLQIALDQPGATIKSLDLEWSKQGKRIQLVQTERKVRGFPDQDGNLPAPGSSSGFEACTRLAFIGAPGDPGREFSQCHGIYDFQLAGLPPWLGFELNDGRALVSGVIRKTSPDQPLHARAGQILRSMYPGFFAEHVDA